METLGTLGEFGLLERIQMWLAEPSESLRLGVGDDAAVWMPTPGQALVLTCDAQVEGRHFLPLKGQCVEQLVAVGRRCAVVNLSDVAAMGAHPRFAMVSLGLVPSLEVESVLSLYRGLAEAFQESHVAIIGGNLTSTEGPCFVDVTLAGECVPGEEIRRSGAQLGDWIGVTGSPGHSAAGLRLLLKGDVAKEGLADGLVEAFQQAYLAPKVRWPFAYEIRDSLHAMADISDGFLADLQHILNASGCGACLEEVRLGFSEELQGLAAAWGESYESLLCAPSDDYELVFCAPEEACAMIEEKGQEHGVSVHWIGRIEKELGLRQKRRDGRIVSMNATGWSHFQEE